MEKKGHNLRVVPGSPADLSERDNDSLMLLARGGLDGAFDALVRRHQTRTLRIAAKYLGQSAVAKDVAQNTFLEIHRALPRYKARGRFESYLYRVLLNQCRMASRAARNAARAQTLLDRPVEVEDPLAEQLILERGAATGLGAAEARGEDLPRVGRRRRAEKLIGEDHDLSLVKLLHTVDEGRRSGDR